MKYIRLFATLSLAAVFTPYCAAQSMGTGTISGLVSDPSGSPAPSATVTALQLSTRTSRNATTNASGNYVLTNMPIGEYAIAAELPGFKKVVQQGVKLDADTTMTVNIPP